MGKIEYDGNRELLGWLHDAIREKQAKEDGVSLVFDGIAYRVEQEDDCLVLYEVYEHPAPPFSAGRVRIVAETDANGPEY